MQTVIADAQKPSVATGESYCFFVQHLCDGPGIWGPSLQFGQFLQQGTDTCYGSG